MHPIKTISGSITREGRKIDARQYDPFAGHVLHLSGDILGLHAL
jgi:hypothetical protein